MRVNEILTEDQQNQINELTGTMFNTQFPGLDRMSDLVLRRKKYVGALKYLLQKRHEFPERFEDAIDKLSRMTGLNHSALVQMYEKLIKSGKMDPID